MFKKNISLLFLLISINAAAQNKDSLAAMFQRLQITKDSNKVKLLFNIANYYIGVSKLDSNKYYLRTALGEAEKSGFKPGIARALTGLGYMYNFEGKYDTALQYFLKSLQIKEALKMTLEAAATREAIGRLFRNLNKPDKSLEYYAEAEKVYRLFNDSSRLIPLQEQIGMCYGEKKDLITELAYYKKVLDIYNRWEEEKSTIIEQPFLHNYKVGLLTNYGYCLLEAGKLKEATAILEPLAVERKKVGGATQVVAQHYLALAYLRSGIYSKALENAREALAVLKASPDMNLRDELKDLNSIMADAYYAIGDYKSAYNAYRSYKELTDTLFNETADRSIAEMQTKYETEKKDREIVILNKEKRSQYIITGLALGTVLIVLALLLFAYRSKRLQKKLFAQKEQLLQNEKEIETGNLQKKMNELEQMALRAQMNPHFIFNSLNSIQHFVMMQDTEGLNKYLGAFAHLIRQTLNNAGKPLISLKEEIEYLETYLSLEKIKSNNHFNYIIHVDENVDGTTISIPGMILQPFVENSIKHGIAQKDSNDGAIQISFSKTNRLTCLIQDNGIGRQKAGLVKTTADGQKYDSKGMSITSSRIETINKMYEADISFSISDVADINANTSGTLVKIEFPLDMES